MKQEPAISRDLEYPARRKFIRHIEASESGSLAESMAVALEEELTPRQRQVVHMYYIDQMLMRDIAETLGVNVSTVSRTIARGRARLKRCLRYGGRALMDSMEL